MNNVIQNICNLFIPANYNQLILEDIVQVKCVATCSDFLYPTKSDFDSLVSSINIRDNIHISIIANDETLNFVDKSEMGFDQYVEEYRSFLEGQDEFKIIITIEKKRLENCYSIYLIDKFIEYFTSLPLLGQLAKINEVFNGREGFYFEIQDDLFKEFNTPLVKFIPINNTPILDEQRNGSSLIKVKNLCHCGLLTKYNFVPNDFYSTTTENKELTIIFNRLVLIYSMLYIFDIVEISSSLINYKLNGYRTINQQVDINDIDISSWNDYFEIYKWVYDGGNIVDKIGLTRNLLSLNFTPNNLQLSESTFDAIKSSFKLYQKENIKQYIEIRNKISEQLLSLQEKAEKIVENYVSDYKKSFLTVVSFYISVIAIRVISKGDFSGGFTFEITLLSIGFLLIFLLVMFYSRWEIKKQIERYEKVYQNMKIRYSDLLEPSDIKRILNNDSDHILNLEHINNNKKKYTELWVLSLIVLLIISIVLFISNSPKSVLLPINNISIKLIISIKTILNALQGIY
ncbi:MAG: hypothetical protein PHT07_03875 [Paludibacter sp.]|nr:hypothetical protein [Paludibacter sp.]